MPPEEFEPAIPASEQPQTHALDSADTVIDWQAYYLLKYAVLLFEG